MIFSKFYVVPFTAKTFVPVSLAKMFPFCSRMTSAVSFLFCATFRVECIPNVLMNFCPTRKSIFDALRKACSPLCGLLAFSFSVAISIIFLSYLYAFKIFYPIGLSLFQHLCSVVFVMLFRVVNQFVSVLLVVFPDAFSVFFYVLLSIAFKATGAPIGVSILSSFVLPKISQRESLLAPGTRFHIITLKGAGSYFGRLFRTHRLARASMRNVKRPFCIAS